MGLITLFKICMLRAVAKAVLRLTGLALLLRLIRP